MVVSNDELTASLTAPSASRSLTFRTRTLDHVPVATRYDSSQLTSFRLATDVVILHIMVWTNSVVP